MHTHQISAVEVVGPHVVRLKTALPIAQMPLRLSAVLIGPRDLAPAETLNTGKGVVGTGPYRFAAWRLGETVDLVRNDSYWGGRPAWDHVHLQTIANDASRVAALLANDVDVADYVRAQDVDVLRAHAHEARHAPGRALQLPRHRFFARPRAPTSPTRPASRSAKNPLLDLRVRRALSLAIDRQAIVARILGGFADAASQPWPGDLAGSSKRLTPLHQDLPEARRLLAEAGYPDGFRLTLGGTVDRYPGDSETVQAVAQMWTRIGVRATPAPTTWTMYTGVRAKHGYPVYYAGASGSDAAQVATSLLHSADDARGLGAQNYGLYANPQVDALPRAIGRQLRRDGLRRGARRSRRDRDGRCRDHSALPLLQHLGLRRARAAPTPSIRAAGARRCRRSHELYLTRTCVRPQPRPLRHPVVDASGTPSPLAPTPRLE